MSYDSAMAKYPTYYNDGFVIKAASTCNTSRNDDGVFIPNVGMLNGKYEWTAYYWDALPEWQGGTF